MQFLFNMSAVKKVCIVFVVCCLLCCLNARWKYLCISYQVFGMIILNHKCLWMFRISTYGGLFIAIIQTSGHTLWQHPTWLRVACGNIGTNRLVFLSARLRASQNTFFIQTCLYVFPVNSLWFSGIPPPTPQSLFLLLLGVFLFVFFTAECFAVAVMCIMQGWGCGGAV